jgi:hypothetical protein
MSTKKQLKERISAITNKYNKSDEIEKDDYDFIMELLLTHPHKKDFIHNISRMFFDKNKQYPTTKCLYLVMNDGTETAVSLPKCVSYSKATEVKMAFRAAIRDDIIQLKGGLLNQDYDAHHEEESFKLLLHKFIEYYHSRDPENWLETVDLVPINGIWSIKDERIRQNWIDYHRKNAVLRVMPRVEHKKIHSGIN